jgi:magnesium-transporting ATPase (P-type)
VSVFGKNVLPEQKKLSRTRLFLRQFHNPLVYIVIIAAIVSYTIGHVVDAVFIMIVIMINAIVGFFQENKAEHSLEKLRHSMQHYVRVVRNGQKKKVLAEDIVVGDVVDVIAGDRISADGRIIDAIELYVNEAVLTGEWHEVQKTVDILDGNIIISDQKNMMFAGTSVTQGHGLYVVTATSTDTEIGKISGFVKNTQQAQTPLQKKFAQLSILIGSAIFAAIMVFAAIGIARGQSFQDIFVASTALTVSAIPEGLLPAITIVLIFGMRRLARQYALVRKLNASETMGAITVICTDKTGTLTKGEMSVSHVLTGANELLNFDSMQTKKNIKNKDLLGHVKAMLLS